MTYLITFTCYGCHLHGDARGAVDRNHNLPGSRLLDPDLHRISEEQRLMDQPPYVLDEARREAVLSALVDRCSSRGRRLWAAHVRSTHIHVVVDSDEQPERVMNDVKSYCSRVLNARELDERDRKRWARHGSTRWLWDREAVARAIQYVVEEQGEPMAVFYAPNGPAEP